MMKHVDLIIALVLAKVAETSKTSKNIVPSVLLGWIEYATFLDLYAKSHTILEGYDLVVMLGHRAEPSDAPHAISLEF